MPTVNGGKVGKCQHLFLPGVLSSEVKNFTPWKILYTRVYVIFRENLFFLC